MKLPRAKKNEPPLTLVASEPNPFPEGVGVGTIPLLTRSEIVAEMAESRAKPRKISAGELIPAEVHEYYGQLWQLEQRALMRDEKRGRFRRAIAALFGLD